MTALRVMTMNLASGSGTSYVDFSCMTHAEFIARVGADIVFLQEVDRGTRRSGGVDQLSALREKTDLHDSHFVSWQDVEGGQYGVAIISRFPLTKLENRSVLKPWQWWPPFIRQVVTPVAHAQINVEGTPVDLYATHFPSSDESRKKYGADLVAAGIPSGGNVIFGGDFNDGPGGVAMQAIDQRFTAAESVAGEVRVQDQPVGVTNGDGIIDRGLDHIYMSGALRCSTWTTRFPVVDGRQFSDHPIGNADLDVPSASPHHSSPVTPRRTLRTSIQPFPLPFNVPATVTVSAFDAASGNPVDGIVVLDGNAVGATGAALNLTLPRSVTRTFNPDTRSWEIEVDLSSVVVKADGFEDATVALR
jgi:endonuclease/exonuclease/phosphatase family metal-dependent hydrolase